MLLWNILWPTFALVLLIFVVWAILVAKRMKHIKASPPRAEDFASTGAAQRYFEPVEGAADNLRNLFEMPVLYFALVPLLLATQSAGIAQALLAWIFVVARAAHSYVHIGPNTVRIRFQLYLASVVVLSAMWIGFFADAVTATIAYRQAMAGLVAR